MTATEQLAANVTDARQRNDADALAHALAVHANALVQDGRLAEAQRALDEAGDIHRSRGRVYDDARCTQLAGTLCRLAGRFDDARSRLQRALALVHSRGAIAVSAHTDLGEIALVENRGTAAADEYRAALDAGVATGLIASARAVLLRKRAAALTLGGDFAAASVDLDAAHAASLECNDQPTAIRVLIEKATLLGHAGRGAEAEPVIQRALEEAASVQDSVALADLQLLVAAQALDRGDVSQAMTAAQAARQHALAANAPTPYAAAAQTIAQLAEVSGDRLGAYESLAVGWVTLGDLLGMDVARLRFAPLLQEARERWGAAAFDAIKQAYETKRREVLDAASRRE